MPVVERAGWLALTEQNVADVAGYCSQLSGPSDRIIIPGYTEQDYPFSYSRCMEQREIIRSLLSQLPQLSETGYLDLETAQYDRENRLWTSYPQYAERLFALAVAAELARYTDSMENYRAQGITPMLMLLEQL